MKKDIILAGVGGQGILSIAAAIGFAAIDSGLHLKQAEVHGMSQRGGDVQSHLRLSDREIASDLIPHGQADMIISVEPMEALRYVPMLADHGYLVTNTEPEKNIPNYPDLDLLLAEIEKIPNHIAMDAGKIALTTGSKKSMNMVVLGGASLFLEIDFEKLKMAVHKLFAKKGPEIIRMNIDALIAGRNFSELSVKK